MEIDGREDTTVEKAVKLGYADARPDPGFRYRLQAHLIDKYAKKTSKEKFGTGKLVLVFGLAAIVVAAIIAYGVWLPGSIDFLAKF